MSELDVQTKEWLKLSWELMIRDPSEAIQYADRVITSTPPESEPHSTARYFRGLCLMYQGYFSASFDELTETLSLANNYKYYLNASRVNNALGMVNHANGRYGQALDHYELTSEYARENNDTPRLVPPLINMSQVFFDMDDIESASEQLDEIDQLETEISDDNLVEIYLLRARIFLEIMQFEQAETFLNKANDLAISIEYASFILRCQEVLGRLRRLQGRLDESKTLLISVIRHPDLSSLGADAVVPYIELSKLLVSNGEISHSISSLEDGLAIIKPRKRSPQNVRALEQLSYVYELAGDVKNNARTLHLLVSAMKHSSERQGQSFLEVRRIKRQQVKDQFQKKLLDQENQALKKAQERLEFLNEIAQQLASTLDYKVLGERLFRIFSNKLNIHFLSLVTTNNHAQCLKFQFIIDQNVHIFNPDISYDEPGSNMVNAMKTRQVVVINDAQVSKGFQTTGGSPTKPRTMLFFPLIQEKEVSGVFSIQSPIPFAFADEEIQLLEAVTKFISIAVSNIQSHETVRQLNKILNIEKKEIESAQQRIEHMAYHDSLTSLPNRQSLDNFISAQIIKSRQEKRNFHLVYIDLDGFKPVNDRYGHRVGDEVLIIISRRIQKALRAHDFAARVGGDEFVLIIDSFAKKGAVRGFLERLLVVIQEPIVVEQHKLMVSASIGAARFPEQGESLDRLMHSADQAMYAIKRLGKGGFQFVESNQ
ncbi:diguanylate cyclase [Reinekea sp.]|jgi:diguanylate cyclase (GGDEF)-like protein|uniref:diguanylate cyclase n=1 Tax=Reinekea sp. TaxID=1970455 RepID=UPI0039897F89